MKNFLIKKLPLLLLAFSLFLNGLLVLKIKNQEKYYLVTQIIDGDTFVLQDNIIARLYRINAPEINFCAGQEAKEYLEKLILGKRLKIETKLRETQGRLLVLAFLKNGQLVNQLVLKNGLVIYEAVNFEENENFKKAVEEAKEKKLGIFSPACYQFENLTNPKCQIKGNVGKTSREKTYHFPGCGRWEDIPVELSWGGRWFCSEEEAQKEGFVKSKNCFEKKYKPE